MADSTNPNLGGHVIQWYYLWGYSKNYWGFQGYNPFHLSLPSLSTIVGISIETIGLDFFEVLNS